jgi:hypothetical protein
MSKKYTYYGSGKSRDYFLDLYPSDYYYSLNRGGKFSTDVCRAVADSTTADLTPEDINQSSLSAIFAGSSDVRIDRLYNQGSVSRDFVQNTLGERPFIADSARLPYIFNGMNYIDFTSATNTRMTTAADLSVLEVNSTVYMVYRSQSAENLGGVFLEQRTALGNQRIGLFSDTRATVFRHTIYAPTGTSNEISYTVQQPTNTIRLVAYRRTGTLIEAFDETGLVGSATDANTFSSNPIFEIGRQQAGPQWFGGHLANLIVRTTSDSNSTMTDIIDFLKLEYGI